MKADNFSEGILQITKAVINEVYIEYGEEPEEGYTPIDDSEEDGYSKKVAVSWVALIAVVLLYLLIFGRRRSFFWFGGPGGFGGFGGGGFSGGFVRRSQRAAVSQAEDFPVAAAHSAAAVPAEVFKLFRRTCRRKNEFLS